MPVEESAEEKTPLPAQDQPPALEEVWNPFEAWNPFPIRPLLIKNKLQAAMNGQAGANIFAPLFKVDPPDFGEEIKDAGAHVEALASEKRIVIISDGFHTSLPVQKQINDLIKAAQPDVVALEFGVAEKPVTEANVFEELNKLKEKLKAEGRLQGEVEKGMMALYEERFRYLQEAQVKMEFIESRTPEEGREIMDASGTLNTLRDLELSGAVPLENMVVVEELRKEATDKIDRINEKMEEITAARIKGLYDASDGKILVLVGQEHVRKGFDLNERLEKLGIPKEAIAIVAVKPTDELPPKPMQVGGMDGAAATIFVEDKENGFSLAQLGGTIISEVSFLDKDHLSKIHDIQFTGRPSGEMLKPQYIGINLVMDPNDGFLGKRTANDIAFPGMQKPVADKIRLIFPWGEEPFVDVDISDLPVKQPGEKPTDEEKKLWMDRLQEGIDELRKKVEAKEKEQPVKHEEIDESSLLSPGFSPAAAGKFPILRNR